MKTEARRILLCLVGLIALALSSSGCVWLLDDAPKLWQTQLGSGMESRSQDMNFMMNREPTEGLGGW